MVKTTSAQRIQKLCGRRLADLEFDVKKFKKLTTSSPEQLKKDSPSTRWFDLIVKQSNLISRLIIKYKPEQNL